MKQKLSSLARLLLAGGILSSILTFAAPALAAIPSLSVSQSGNSVTLSVSNADANQPVFLYQKQSQSNWNVSSSLGNTDSSGNFTSTQTINFDGSSNPVQLYVLIDNLSSPTLQLAPGTCSSNCTNSGLTLSQTSVSVNTGQAVTVLATPSSGTVSVTANTNSSVANYILSGNSIVITGQTTGTTTLTVCAGSNQCGSILVTVNGASSTSLNFSVASPVVVLGQSQTVNIYSPSVSSGSFYVSNNSNSNVVTASISGSTLFLMGQTIGNSTLNICQTGAAFCGTMAVTVGLSGTSNNGFNLSTNSLTMSVGQTNTVTVYNALGALSIGNNSNSSVVSAGVSGQTITVYAISAGSSSLSICQNGYSGCLTLFVSVSGSSTSTYNGTISFSNSNPILTIGQNQSLAIYSSGTTTPSYTISSNSNPNAVSLSLSGTVLYLVGQATGNSNISVCQTGTSVCGTVYVTVNGQNGGLTFNPTSINVAQNQNLSVTISGGNGNYYLSGNTNPSAAAVSLQSSSLLITGLNAGTANLTVCQTNNAALCGTIIATVTSGTQTTSGVITLTPTSRTINVGQTAAVTISGGNGNYYISLIGNPTVASVNISGSVLNITGSTVGTSSVTICQTGGSSCGILSITVNAANSPTPTPSASPTPTVAPTPTPAPTSIAMPSVTPTPAVSTYHNGELISEKGTVYIVFQNTKVAFANAPAFLGLGFLFKNVIAVTDSGLTLSPKVVITADGAHPRGTWLLDGKTVYFLTPAGLIPVPTWDIFLQNGGDASYIVKANPRDLAFTKLPAMTASDARLMP